jgi:DNA-binding NarL/FixJ family response regulator
MTAKAQPHRRTGETRVFLVDDEALVRTALRTCIEHHPDWSVVGEAADERTALEGIHWLRPDVVITDLCLQDGDGIALIRKLSRTYPRLKILAFTAHDSAIHVTHALAAGVHGFVLKEDGTRRLIEAVMRLLRGEIFISGKVRKFIPGSSNTLPSKPHDPLGAG